MTIPVALLERLTGVLERIDEKLGVPRPDRPSDSLLTIDQVAARLQKSRRHVERLVRKGRLKKVPNLGKRSTRFRPIDVDALIAGGKENLPGARRL